MNEWNIRSIPQDQRGIYASLVSEEWQAFLYENETELLAADINETPCGALLARTSNDRYEVVSLYVTEQYRQQGIGGELMHAAEQAAVANGYGTLDVCYGVSADQSEQYLHYFLKQGFLLPREHACYYSLPADRLAQTQLAAIPPISEKALAHFFPVSAIPDADARVSYSFITSRLPIGMHADYAPGTVLDDYSLCYVSQKNVIAFVIFSEWEGRLHLHCAYADGASSGKALIALMRRVYDLFMQESERFSGFSTTIVNDSSYKMAKTLLAGGEPVERHIYYTQKPLQYTTPLLPEWGGVLARSNALYDALANSGGTVSLYAEPGMLPYLTWQPEAGMELELFYSVKNEDYTAFSLVAQMLFDAPLEQLALHKQAMEEDPGPARLVHDADEQSLALVAVQDEGAGFVPEQTIEGFLKPFIEQSKRLRAKGIR